MMMKKITIIFAALAAAAISSCSLKEQSYTELNKKDYPESAKEANTVLMGCYRDMCEDGMYAYHLSLLFTISSDIAQCEGSSTSSFRVIPTNYHNVNTTEILTTWSSLYNAIYNVNDFIQTVQYRMQWWSNADQDLARIYVAEAKALRALYYFELVRWYGNVVLMKTTQDSFKKAGEYVQAAPNEVYEFIEKDLLEAQESLPWAVDDNLRGSNAYRISKGAALGLLAKVYCTWAGYPLYKTDKWGEAAAVARRVVESGKHRLNPDFEELWSNTCNGVWDPYESLIEVSFFSPTGLNGEDCVGRIGKWNGVVASAVEGKRGRNAANWKVVYPFVQEWETHDDPRLELSVADYRYGYTNKDKTIDTDGYIKYFDTITKKNPSEDDYNAQRQLFTPAKWDTEKYVQGSNYLVNNDKSNVNWYVLRYADVLLLFAEAENEANGPTAAAVEAFNLVRERAYGDDSHNVSSSMTREEFREIIRKERAYELCFEGHRKQDLIRWGIYYETIKKTAQDVLDWYTRGNYTVAIHTIKGRHELMPIPQRELDLMTSCKQNDGWGR